MLIGGKLEGGSARFDVRNPANEQVIGSAPDATQADLDRSINLLRDRVGLPHLSASPAADPVMQSRFPAIAPVLKRSARWELLAI